MMINETTFVDTGLTLTILPPQSAHIRVCDIISYMSRPVVTKTATTVEHKICFLAALFLVHHVWIVLIMTIA